MMKKWQIIILSFVIVVLSITIITRGRVLYISNNYILDSNNINSLEECRDVIVLGAGVRADGSMSPILEERAITAKDLYTKGKACKILVTGFKREVEPVKQYLLDKGIPNNLILIDEKGIDTITSMKNAHNIYKINKAIIITQDFHLPRAVYLARTQGIDAIGYKAYKFYPYIMLEEYKYIIRDYLASVKAVWQSEINNS